MVVVHEVELLDEHPPRPPFLHQSHLQGHTQGTVPLPIHHHSHQRHTQQLTQSLKLPGGGSSLPRHQLPSAPYHDPTTEDDDDDDEDEDDLPEYAEAGPPSGNLFFFIFHAKNRLGTQNPVVM